MRCILASWGRELNRRSLEWSSKEFWREFIVVEIHFSVGANEWARAKRILLIFSEFVLQAGFRTIFCDEFQWARDAG
jgi:hypothetical protein